MADSKLSALTEVSVPELEDLLYMVEDPAGTPTSRKASGSRILGLITGICDGRLTLTSNLAVTTADVIGATNVYFTPYLGDRVSLYDGTRWRLYSFSQLTLAVGTLTSGLPYDVFLYDNAGTLTLEAAAWTNGTTRATALVLQNGVWCKTGALTRRYLGSFYTTATTTTEDSEAKRLLWNMYHRVPRKLKKVETASTWTITGSTSGTPPWGMLNASSANRVQVMAGLAESSLELGVYAGMATGTTAGAYVSVGIQRDGTGGGATDNQCDMMYRCGAETIAGANSHQVPVAGVLSEVVPVGFHYYQAMQWSGFFAVALTIIGTSTTTNSRLAGLLGTVQA